MSPVFWCVFIVIVHYVLDFQLQTPWEAENKWTNWKALVSHTLTYGMGWLVIGTLLCGWPVLFALITFVLHTATDYVTSKWSHFYNEKKDWHNFFCVIGFDQVLHYTQLFLTLHYLTTLV